MYCVCGITPLPSTFCKNKFNKEWVGVILLYALVKIISPISRLSVLGWWRKPDYLEKTNHL